MVKKQLRKYLVQWHKCHNHDLKPPSADEEKNRDLSPLPLTAWPWQATQTFGCTKETNDTTLNI